jgi:hypothetical protein
MAAPTDKPADPASPPQPLHLITGDLVLAEPEARRIAEVLAKAAGCEVEEHRRPPRLGPILDDLKTFSLFATAKVLLVVDSAVLADRTAAAALVDDAAGVLPFEADGASSQLAHRERHAASRLLQALRLFNLDPLKGSAEALLDELPPWALEGAPAKGKRKRTKKAVEQLRRDLVPLLEAARDSGLVGWAEDEATALAAILGDTLPPGHCLVLAERSVADDHPVVKALAERKTLVRVGTVAGTKDGGWAGLDKLVRHLEQETGVGIDRPALDELARRTLRQEGDWRSKEGAEADSTARFAGEYRKLADMTREGRIGKDLVARVVLDRGQEDVWAILDAIGAGKGGPALTRMRRLLSSTEDPVGERLKFFGLLAVFCRQLAAIRGMVRSERIPPTERNYGRFKTQIAPRLQAELPAGVKNPLAGLHPYRLHRAYLAAARLPEATANELPWRVLETEWMLKGESRDAEAALSQLVVRLVG